MKAETMTPMPTLRYAVFIIDPQRSPPTLHVWRARGQDNRPLHDLTKAQAFAELHRLREQDRATRYEVWLDRTLPSDTQPKGDPDHAR